MKNLQNIWIHRIIINQFKIKTTVAALCGTFFKLKPEMKNKGFQ